ncbi:MAG: NUDIX domain-containing protein [Acidimicrobiia bacterium]|nr:NUDIX domain-containing protein [Acidimicrobiia bacterium]
MSAANGPTGALVRAAGGLVWRPVEEGVEVLLVHRPRRQDWSFPKGKLDPGESFEEAARREVAEETGLDCRLGADLGSVRYTDHRGRPKVVRWWEMQVERGAFVPNDEVDEVRWATPADARSLLTWASDAEVLERFGAAALGR